MVQVFEAGMLICFGISWPLAVYKDLKSKTAKGKSVIFTIAIIVGYLCGIGAKLYAHLGDGQDLSFVLYLYILNLLMVTADLIITLQNKKRDRQAS